MASDVEKYRQRLIQERDELNKDIGTVAEISQPRPDDLQVTAANAPVLAEARDIEHRIVDMKSDRMGQLNAAIQAIDDGTYGTCIKCGKEINPKRLDADPAVMTCVECQAAAEQGLETPQL